MTGNDQHDVTVLAINSGSSSLKCGLYRGVEKQQQVLLSAVIGSLGSPESQLQVKDGHGRVLTEESKSLPSPSAALAWGIDRLVSLGKTQPDAIGHRIVHGGPLLLEHQRITPSVIETLEKSTHFAPLHIPPALDLIRHVTDLYPEMPQFACFDTVFHRTMPEAASHFALPQSLWSEGVRRYGFHGLSYESIVRLLESGLRPRTVVAHLGNGSSLAALKDGLSVDTSMGFTPTGGIPMGTRSGDLDPGVLLYLMRRPKLDTDRTAADRLESLLNHQSGLAGLSGGVSDMRALEAAADAGDGRASLAIEIFSRSIAKTIAAYSAVLGGLDLVVFTAGIGENSERVRALSCDRLGFLGIALDPERNAHGEDVISTAASRCLVRVVPTDEDGQIARHTRRLYTPFMASGIQGQR
jgi:acetate kinase